MLFRGENDSVRKNIGVNRVNEKGPILALATYENCWFHSCLYGLCEKTEFGVIWNGFGK